MTNIKSNNSTSLYEQVNVNARVIAKQGAGFTSTTNYATVIKIPCAIGTTNGVLTSGEWVYTIPHTFNNKDIIATITNSNTGQQVEADISYGISSVIVRLAAAATECYDVLLIGYVAFG